MLSPVTATTVDFDDDQSSSMCSAFEDQRDVLRIMKKQEATVYRRPCVDAVHAPWRRLMVGWMCTISDVFDLRRNVVSLAIHYLDECMAGHLSADTPSEYQLVCLTALQLAIKVTEVDIFPLDKLVQFSQGNFTADDVVQMEQRMFVALNWRLNPPTSECFLEQYIQLLPKSVGKKSRQQVYETSLYLLREAAIQGGFRSSLPSCLAYGAMLVAVERSSGPAVTLEQKRTFANHMQLAADLTNESKGLLQAYQGLWPLAEKIVGKVASSSSDDEDCCDDREQDNAWVEEQTTQEAATLSTTTIYSEDYSAGHYPAVEVTHTSTLNRLCESKVISKTISPRTVTRET